jgi:hypothetical protein
MRKVRVITDEKNRCSTIYQMNSFVFSIFKTLKWFGLIKLSDFCDSWFWGLFIDLIGFEINGEFKPVEVDNNDDEEKRIKIKLYPLNEWRRPF